MEMIILPFHKQWKGEEGDELAVVENVGNRWREINQRVLETALCSVGVLIDQGFNCTTTSSEQAAERVGFLFVGGPDDREALKLGGRLMAGHHQLAHVTLVRFVQREGNQREKVNMLNFIQHFFETEYIQFMSTFL